MLGLDPGLGVTGWGVIEAEANHLRHLADGVVETDAELPLPARLAALHEALASIIATWRPDEAAVAKAQELAGDRVVEVAAGDAGGQALAAGLVDEVRMDVVPVVFGTGKRFFGSVDAQHLLEDPDTVIQGNRVLHLRYRERR